MTEGVPGRGTVAVVIPCHRVSRHILELLGAFGPEVGGIYVVDDACPEQSGRLVESGCQDPRVRVLYHEHNQGVGGAVMTGYVAALRDGMRIIVKVDGDGQMNPALIPDFVRPIAAGWADYTKGNRFFDLEGVRRMPRMRLFGNAVLSLFSKFSTGYWDLFDPTNGFTAIDARVAALLPLDKISRRYFFETDILFRLNTLRAVVVDIPMHARYADEVSGLRISAVVFEFVGKHLRNFIKRIFYNYYLRDMSVASFELPLGLALVLFGAIFGAHHWWNSIHTGHVTPAGTVMVAAIPLLMGVQSLLAFLAYDIGTVPRRPLQQVLAHDRR